jgi:thioredoxin reductase (NADPH)
MQSPVWPAKRIIALAGSLEKVFPSLSEAQIKRVAAYGTRRTVQTGEVLYEQGIANAPFFVLLSAELEAVRPTELGKRLVALRGRGQFTGEVNALSGRATVLQIDVTKSGEVIELDRPALLRLVQTDAEIGEIIMRAFILRRVGLVSSGIGDVVLIGSAYSAGTLRLKEFLMRNGHPYSYLDLEHHAEVEQLMTLFNIAAGDVPVVICRGKTVLRNPSNRDVAKCLGVNECIDERRVRDLVVIGAGPSGLASAVYGASEGLDVLVIETNAPGGQAGSSSRIENYLGFPTGVSGQELAGRAFTQAEKFGAELLFDRVAHLDCESVPYCLTLESGAKVMARSVVIASGAQYRKPAIGNLHCFENAGVYYGATFIEAQPCAGEDVVIVGGGNSAGQAAVYLSGTARNVYMIVRSGGFAQSMSRYLIRRIEETPNIEVYPRTEIVSLEGSDRLESICWRNLQTAAIDEHPIRHVFMMTGATPNTDWLSGCVALDDTGFVKTGTDLNAGDLTAAHWPLERAPYLFETSSPGAFAVGDVRAGSVKRVASAVGEGSIAISFVHRALAH